jgi:hypothetical protein
MLFGRAGFLLLQLVEHSLVAFVRPASPVMLAAFMRQVRAGGIDLSQRGRPASGAPQARRLRRFP